MNRSLRGTGQNSLVFSLTAACGALRHFDSLASCRNCMDQFLLAKLSTYEKVEGSKESILVSSCCPETPSFWEQSKERWNLGVNPRFSFAAPISTIPGSPASSNLNPFDTGEGGRDLISRSPLPCLHQEANRSLLEETTSLRRCPKGQTLQRMTPKEKREISTPSRDPSEKCGAYRKKQMKPERREALLRNQAPQFPLRNQQKNRHMETPKKKEDADETSPSGLRADKKPRRSVILTPRRRQIKEGRSWLEPGSCKGRQFHRGTCGSLKAHHRWRGAHCCQRANPFTAIAVAAEP